MAEAPKLKVLFLCGRNACRSQMAEGWTRALKSDIIEPHSAGIEASEIDPRAVHVMAEAGVDIRGQLAKPLNRFRRTRLDYVVALWKGVEEKCPVFFGKARVLHVGFEDPPELARGARTEEEGLAHYRRVRDEIRAFVEKLPEALRD
jgi:arsenate reductase